MAAAATGGRATEASRVVSRSEAGRDSGKTQSLRSHLLYLAVGINLRVVSSTVMHL